MSDCNFICWLVYKAVSWEEKVIVLKGVEGDQGKVEIGLWSTWL